MRATRILPIVALFVVAGVASAHHGSAISRDLSNQVTLTGLSDEEVLREKMREPAGGVVR